MIKKIISGAQTGTDLAALEAAISYGMEYGGWCPQGRINENGKIPEKYSGLTEIPGMFKSEQDNYNARTKYNIRDSDGTLILAPKIPLPLHIKDGTLLTIQEVKRQNKPYLILDLSESKEKNAEKIANWTEKNCINILNVAGPRESSSPGIYESSLHFLRDVVMPELVSLKPRAKL